MLRRRGTPAGGLALLCLVLPLPAYAATPAPDPPPEAVAPEAPPVARHDPARTGPQGPGGRRARACRPPCRAGHARAAGAEARRRRRRPSQKAKPSVKKPVARPVQRRPSRSPRTARPRACAARRVRPAVDELDRGLLAFAGIALLLVALGGARAARASRGGSCRCSGFGLLLFVAPSGRGDAPSEFHARRALRARTVVPSNVTIRWELTEPDPSPRPAVRAQSSSPPKGDKHAQCTRHVLRGHGHEPVVDDQDRQDGAGRYRRRSLVRRTRTAGTTIRSRSRSRARRRLRCRGLLEPDLRWRRRRVAGSRARAPTSPGTRARGSPSSTTRRRRRDLLVRRPASRREGLVPKAADGELRGHRHHVRDRGVHRADAVRRARTSRAPRSSDRAATRPATLLRPARRSSTTRPRRRSRRPKSQGCGRRIGWTASGDFVEVEPSAPGSTARSDRSSTAATASVRRQDREGRHPLPLSASPSCAGNKSGRRPGPARTLLSLARRGRVVKAPPLLRWKAVKGATFYNVQLYRNGGKLLSTWPRAAKLQLGRTWRYGGKRQRLQPGLYRWYVWGARGTLERPTYGRVLGSSTFRIRR